MKRRLLPILIANLLAAPVALAQEGLKPGATAPEGLKWKWTGNIGIGGIYTDDSSRNPWKLFEYRDLDSGVLSNIELRGRGERDYLDFFAENIGREDMFIDLRGGRYNVFKYQLYGDWLQHNLSFGPDGARTPYAGFGTSTLSAAFPQLNSNVPPWNSFDFETKSRVLGGNFEFSNIYVSPWYARVDANEVRTKGINVASAANGTSPGNGFVDLPSPVDQLNRSVALEGGYATTQGNFGVNFLYSKFTNDDPLLRWTNPFFGLNQLDTTVLAPESDLWKLSANGALRGLPWNSTLAGRITYSELTDDVGMLGSQLTTGPAYVSSNPTAGTFSGKIRNTTVSASWTAIPVRRLDTKVYYNYYDKKNDSNQITFNNCTLTVVPVASCQTELFGYTKNNAGADAGYRFNPQNRLSGGIDYLHIDRDRADYPKTEQWTLGAQWRNSSFDWLGVLLGAAYVHRRSDLGAIATAGGNNANDPLFLERFVTRFDASSVNQTRIRLVLDSSPVPFLDLGFEAYWKWNDYQANNGFDPALGRTKDDRQEYYLSISFGDPRSLRMTFFGDIEFIDYDSFHRNINGGGCGAPVNTPNCFNPDTAPVPNAYNWSAENKDKNWAVGAGLDWKPIERLTVKSSVIWSRTDGSADIVSQNNFGNPLPITAYDTSTKVSFNIKGIYQYDRNWQFTGGYAYEDYTYNDIQYNGYQYTIGTPPSASYLSGAYAFPNYTANIFYAVVNYKFF